MDVPSMTSELGKMAVSQHDPVDRADSAAPDCTGPDAPAESTTTLDAAPSVSPAPKSAPLAATATDLPKPSRPRTVSACHRPGSLDPTQGSSSNSTSLASSENASPSKPDPATPSKSLVSPLKATAIDFVPSPRTPLNSEAIEFTPSSHSQPATIASPLFEVRVSARGGSGVFATQNIPLGTRIICEPPMLKIQPNDLYLVWGPYCRLSNSQKQEYDSLYFWENTDLGLEQASRMYLLDPTDDAVESDDEEELIAEHVRVMSIFAVNNFEMGNGALGLFPNGARLNHSCIPNVNHSYNPTLGTLGKLTVHALKDISEGEELLMNYIGTACHMEDHHKRWAYLRPHYGFTCQCEACTDSTGVSDSRHEALSVLLWGIREFQKGELVPGNPYVPESATLALSQAEDIIKLLIDQGLGAIELLRAFRLASSLAMDVGDLRRALEYASDEAEVERNIFGTELDDLKKKGVASEVWIKQLYHMAKALDFSPHRDLAMKIHNTTGVSHEILTEKNTAEKFTKKQKKKNSQTPRGGKSHKYKLKLSSPEKQEMSDSKKPEAATP